MMKIISLEQFSDKYHQIDIKPLQCIPIIDNNINIYTEFFLYASSNKYSSLEEFLAACWKYILKNYQYDKSIYCDSIEITFRDDLLESEGFIKKISKSRAMSTIMEGEGKESDLKKIYKVLEGIEHTLQYGEINSAGSSHIFYSNAKYCLYECFPP